MHGRRWTLALGALLLGQNAAAEGESNDVERIALSFRAPPACGTDEALSERVLERSERIRFDEALAEHTVSVNIDGGPPLAAQVKIRTPDETSSRELSGASCAELLDAIALVIVVTLDPTGRWMTEEPREGSTTPSPSPAPSVEPEPAARGNEASVVEPAPATPSLEEPPPVVTPPDLPSPFAGYSWVRKRVSVLAAARALDGPAPRPLLGPLLGVDLEIAPERVLSPRLALGFGRSWSGSIVESGGTAEFTLDQATLELCPFRFGQQRWELRPCFAGAFGRMLARGSGAEAAREVERPWTSLGALALARVELVGALSLWASAGVVVPLVRDRYEFEPIVFYEVPAQERNLAVGLSLELPP